MKKCISLFIFCAMISSHAFGQLPLEVFVGDRQIQYLGYFQKDFDAQGRWNIFGLSLFSVDYKDSTLNNSSIEGQLTYQFTDWLGISAGGGFEDNKFSPNLGLSLGYISAKQDFILETYPTLQLTRPLALDLLGLVIYSPSFNEKWGFFSQVIFGLNLGFQEDETSKNREIFSMPHNQSFQLGINYDKTFQMGLGADFSQFSINGEGFNTRNIGVFLRYQFD